MATPNTERVKCERSTAKDGQLAVTMWKGNPTTFQLGLFESGSAINISGLSSVTWRVKNARTGTTVLMAKTVSDLTACSGSQWQTAAGQHASISFNADECNLAVTGKSAVFHLTITGLLTGGEEVTFGMGTLTVINANAAPAGDPPTNPDPAMSSGQADGRYVRFDGEQGLTPEQQEQARVNIGVTSGGDEYSADVATFLAASDKAGMRSAMDLGDAAVKNIGTTAGTVAAGDHSHTGLTVQAPATPSVRALGSTSTTACPGNDSRLSDARNPTAHTHDLDDVILLPESLQTLSDEIDTKAAASHTHADATTGAAGFMTAAMVTKLNGIAAGASLNGSLGSIANIVPKTSGTGGQTLTLTDISIDGSNNLSLGSNSMLRWPGRAGLSAPSSTGVRVLDLLGTGPAAIQASIFGGWSVSGTNQAGGDISVRPRNGTGNQASGSVHIEAHRGGTSGSTAGTFQPMLSVGPTGLTGRAGEGTDFFRLAGNRYTSDTVSMQDQLDTDQILHQCSLVAGTLARTGDRLEITAEMACSLGSDNGTWRLYLNATLVASYETNNNLPGRIRASVRRVNGAQVKVSLEEIPPPGGLPYASPLVPAWVSVDFADTLTVTVSGQSGGSSNVTSELLCVDFFPAR